MTNKTEINWHCLIEETEDKKLTVQAPTAKPLALSLKDKFLGLLGIISLGGHKSALKHFEEYRSNLLELIINELNNWKCKQDESHKKEIESLEKKICETELNCENTIQEAFARNGIKSSQNETKQAPIVPLGGLEIEPHHIDVFSKHLTKNGIELSDEQEKVLYSNHRATNVLAGAGSGKSTVLSLRIVFMNKCLGIPLSSITVTTFTRESRKDFITKLAKDFKMWGEEQLSEKELKSVVRTFHSIAFEVNRRFNSDGRKLIFGDKTPKTDPNDEYGIDVENMYADDSDSIEDPDDNVDKMSEILLYVYKVTYSQNIDFKHKINQLYLSTLGDKPDGEFEWEKNYYGLEYEDSIPQLLAKDWVAEHPYYFKNLPEDIRKPGIVKIREKNVKYHLYLKNLDAKIFLGRPSGHFEDKVIPGTRSKIFPILRARRSIIRNIAPVNYLWVDNLDQLKHLVHLNDYTAIPMPETDVVPGFSYTLTGDIPKKDAQIYSQLHSFCQFAYSLGINLKEQSETQIKQYFSHCNPLDLCYVSAAKIFQAELEAELKVRRLITFDEIFHEFGNTNSPLYENADLSQLSKITHLLIDEFQDISPNIIKFLTVLKQKRMRATEHRDGSIICVGDDYQSIYGWRGSSPHFILDFKNCFPLQKEFCELSLINNYRSSEKILAKAKICTERLKYASHKGYVAAGDNAQNPDSEFRIFAEVKKKDSEKTCIDYAELIKQLAAEIDLMAAHKANPIFLLYRSRSHVYGSSLPVEWKSFFSDVVKAGQVKALTIHTSKGLEADSVFIIGDISYSYKHPVKNALYALGKMKFNYDFAQTEEAKRLGYVAITRAKKRVKWFLNSRSNDNSLGKIYFSAENA